LAENLKYGSGIPLFFFFWSEATMSYPHCGAWLGIRSWFSIRVFSQFVSK